MDEYAEEKRTEKNLIVRSDISEAETTNNIRLRSTFCTEAIQTRSILRPLCNSRASCFFFKAKRDTRVVETKRRYQESDFLAFLLFYKATLRFVIFSHQNVKQVHSPV